MTIVVGYLPTPEGGAALQRAIEEAGRTGESLAIVNSARTPRDTDAPISVEQIEDALVSRLDEAGLAHTVRQLDDDEDAASVILEVAEQVRASAVVIGIRRRSPVGKLLLGSSAQRILLGAHCPVIAVKP